MLKPLTRVTDALDKASMEATKKSWESVLGVYDHPDGDWGSWLAAVFHWAVATITIPLWIAMSLLNVAVCCLVGIGRLVGSLFK